MNIDSSYMGVGMAAAATPVMPDKLAEHRELIQAVKAVNASEMLGDKNMLTFAIDRDTHRPVVRILDRETNELVSQIPPETLLRLAADLKAMEK